MNTSDIAGDGSGQGSGGGGGGGGGRYGDGGGSKKNADGNKMSGLGAGRVLGAASSTADDDEPPRDDLRQQLHTKWETDKKLQKRWVNIESITVTTQYMSCSTLY
jgi:hypothetical protein